MESKWTAFKVGRLVGEELVTGKTRGEVQTTPTSNIEAPAPYYWNVVSFKRGVGNNGCVAEGFAFSVDAAKVACVAAMGC